MKPSFHIASEDEIKRGETTDAYFARTKEILEKKGLSGVRVVAEVTPGQLPSSWSWAILCGVDEVAKLFEGIPVDVYCMPEGSIFYHTDHFGLREPILFIEGSYGEFCVYETPLLGLLCQASGIATMAARIRKMVPDKMLLSFGVRRMHPMLAPMMGRSAYIGGFDAVSNLAGAKAIGKKPVGTMPHALIIVFEDQVKAWQAFDEIAEPEVPRIALVDTYFDEKVEAIMAAEALKERLYGVRLDTPTSRKGDFAEIIREVRWELDLRGFKHVKIVVSGGISDENVKELAEAGADAFGVGTALSNAPTIDFAMDIVEAKGKPVAKRGKLGGKKQVWRCQRCLTDIIVPFDQEAPSCPKCDGEMVSMLKPLVEGGRVRRLPSVDEIRSYVLNQLEKLPPIS